MGPDQLGGGLELTGDDGEIVIRCPRKDFGDFLSGLLAQPQTIRKTHSGIFTIDINWLQNLETIVFQRIVVQNGGRFVSSSVDVYCSKGLSRNFSSVDAYKMHHETRPVHTVGFRTSWSFLVKFPGRNVEEKQTVSIYAHSISPEHYEKRSSTFPEPGVFRILVEHTERTWGDDIEAAVSNHVLSHVEEIGSIKAMFRRNVVGFSSALFVAMIFLADGLVLAFLGKYYGVYEALSSDSTEVGKGDIVAALIESVRINYMVVERKALSIGVIIIIPAVMSMSMLIMSRIRHSHILFNEEDRKNAEKVGRRDRAFTLASYGAFIVSVVASIVATYLVRAFG